MIDLGNTINDVVGAFSYNYETQCGLKRAIFRRNENRTFPSFYRRRDACVSGSARCRAGYVSIKPALKTVRQLEKLIRSELAERGSNRSELEWLCDQLCEYLEHWLGFAGFATTPQLLVRAACENDLFRCVKAAINVIDDFPKLLPNSKAVTAWSEFRDSVEWIRRSPNLQDLRIIVDTFISFGKTALSKEFQLDPRLAIPSKASKIRNIT